MYIDDIRQEEERWCPGASGASMYSNRALTVRIGGPAGLADSRSIGRFGRPNDPHLVRIRFARPYQCHILRQNARTDRGRMRVCASASARALAQSDYAHRSMQSRCASSAAATTLVTALGK